MTLNQLRTFLAVAEHESVHGAAQELVVTQAAVSASLAALQKALGLALVAPDGRGLQLTDAGREYASYARRIIGLLDEAGRAAAACADPERGELRIAAVTTAAEQVVPGILGGFRREHPLTGIRLEAGNRDQVRSLLDRHHVDLPPGLGAAGDRQVDLVPVEQGPDPLPVAGLQPDPGQRVLAPEPAEDVRHHLLGGGGHGGDPQLAALRVGAGRGGEPGLVDQAEDAAGVAGVFAPRVGKP